MINSFLFPSLVLLPLLSGTNLSQGKEEISTISVSNYSSSLSEIHSLKSQKVQQSVLKIEKFDNSID